MSHPWPSTLGDNTQPYPSQPHFLTETHIVMRAASCKIASLHPQAVTHENQVVKYSSHTPGLWPQQSIREKTFPSIVVLNQDFQRGRLPPQQPCYLTLLNRKFKSKFNPTTIISDWPWRYSPSQGLHKTFFSLPHCTVGFSRINLHDTNYRKKSIFLSPLPGRLISTLAQDSFHLPMA